MKLIIREDQEPVLTSGRFHKRMNRRTLAANKNLQRLVVHSELVMQIENVDLLAPHGMIRNVTAALGVWFDESHGLTDDTRSRNGATTRRCLQRRCCDEEIGCQW